MSVYFKGLDINEKGLDLISNLIRRSLGIQCAVLMGANIASEVARENFCEATIGTVTCGRSFKSTWPLFNGHFPHQA